MRILTLDSREQTFKAQVSDESDLNLTKEKDKEQKNRVKGGNLESDSDVTIPTLDYDTNQSETVDRVQNLSQQGIISESTLHPYQSGTPHRESFEGYPIIGPIKFKDGQTYDGQHKNGKLHAFGLLVFGDGSGYHGYFEDGQIRGHGRYVTADGRVYEGFTDPKGQKTGYGYMIGKNGNRYEGMF